MAVAAAAPRLPAAAAMAAGKSQACHCITMNTPHRLLTGNRLCQTGDWL